ncbi:NAD(P)-dependent alcohol dehydrogenase [Microbacterium sp. NPDC076911]|uniref:NAD(P)-dependent alcohol dehydrogenase n=1 Tax=Microbacterium sp. NPDC076911 TaxID=3154958 RepID=UPI0034415DAB
MEVRAAVAREARQPLQLMTLQLDEPRANEVRVKMVAAGVCHTDASVRDQLLPTPLPVVLGHEGAGIVVEVGAAVRAVEVGDHVVLGSTSCGFCKWCLVGYPADCVNAGVYKWSAKRSDRTTAYADGAEAIGSHFFGQSSFSTYANVDARTVIKVPKSTPLRHAAALGCGMATGAGTVFNVLRPEPGSSIAVFGTGAVGCAAMLAAVVAHCSTIIMVDVVDSRLQRAMELGATHVVNGSREDSVAVIREITGDGVQFAVDTTSSAQVFRQMLDSLATRGHATRLGEAAPGDNAVIDHGKIMKRSQRITGVRQGDAVPQVIVPQLLELHSAGRFAFTELIEVFPFEQINDAFDASACGRTIKPIVVF